MKTLRSLRALASLQLSFLSLGALAQTQSGEHLVPLTANPIQQAEYASHSMQRLAHVSTQSITLPSSGIRDNFSYESHRPDTSLWDLSLNPGVFVNRTWAISPMDLGVCTFDGLDYKGEPYNELAGNSSTGKCDSLVSRSIDLSGYSVGDSVYLSFWYEPKGRGYAPNTQDSLILQFNVPSWNPSAFNTVWKTIWFKEGYTPLSADSGFHIAMIKLDSASYFVDGFRFLIRNYATQCGSNDHWHIDDVYMKSQRFMGDTLSRHVDFVYPSSSALAKYWAMPNKHYKPSVDMATNFNVQIVNHDTISAGRSVTYWYEFLDENNAQLALYPSAAGVTQTILPYTTSGYMSYAPISNPPISFTGYPQTAVNNDTGTYKFRHILHSSTDIDTMVQIQKFYNYYAYDDGTAEVGYGLIGSNSILAYEFTMPSATTDTLKAIQMYFLPVHDLPNLELREFQLTVWDDNNGNPGSVIYRQRNQNPKYSYETPDRFVTYTIDSGTVVLNAGMKYYIGWVQQAADILYLGFDYNTDNSSKIHYNTSGPWYTSIYPGSLMMRPVFGEIYSTGNDNSGIAENSYIQFSLYPNPTNDVLYFKGLDATKTYQYTILDVAGRECTVYQPLLSSMIELGDFFPGVYFVRICDDHGNCIGTKPFIIAR